MYITRLGEVNIGMEGIMISLYSGTPGSGKSLDVARTLYWSVRNGKQCICNFPINTARYKKYPDNFHFWDNSQLTPERLTEFAEEINQKRGKVKENSILLVIDECQLLFNSRDWGRKDRSSWLSFFTLHRHLGYEIILVAQFDRMLDRQIRALIEYEYIHRKISNFGWKGFLISTFAGGKLFVAVKMWYPMKERVGSEFFRAKKFYYSLYDSYARFDRDRTRMGDGGGPVEDCPGEAPYT